MSAETVKGGAPTNPDEAVLFTIRPLAAADPPEIEALLDLAFGTDRHGRTAYRLRRGMLPLPDLSFAAFDGAGTLVGTVQSWPVQLGGEFGATPLVLVGPVAVTPAQQGLGLGRALMERMLAAWDGGTPLVLIGDPDYYGRFFGFTAAATGDWRLPGPVERHRLLARATGPLPITGSLGPRD